MKLFLEDPKIKELIQGQPDIHLAIRDKDYYSGPFGGFGAIWFGANFPEEVDELYFECCDTIGDTIRDHRRLKPLFNLFSVNLMRLVQIGSAYEDDPKVDAKNLWPTLK